MAKDSGEKKDQKSYLDYEDHLIEYLTSPSTIIQKPTEIEIEKHHQVIAAINYPRVVDPGWLTRLIEMNLDFDLSMHISPYSVGTTVAMLENELKKQKTDIYALETEGKIVPQALIQQHEDTTSLLQLIQEGSEKMFDISLYIDAKGFSDEDVEKTSKIIRNTMNSLMIIPKIPSYQMLPALKSVLPVADDQLKVLRNITSSAAAACFPFAITSFETHATGILIGFNAVNSIPIIIDPFELSNPNILVLGTSGGGKSYSIKLILMREFMEGVDINVIDPQGEYTDLVKTFNGQIIKIAPGSDSVINPFDLMDQTLDEKKLSLLAFFRVMLGELTEPERAILDDTIDRTYEEKGITKDPKSWSKEPPVLEDLYNEVMPLTRSTKEIIYRPAMAIVNTLKSYVFGPMRFMNQQTKMNLGNRMISFDIRDAPDVGKGTLMFLILEYVYTQMKKSKTRKMLVVDEAWTILSSGEQSEYILRLIKTCRKFNLSLVMITQDVEDVLSSRAGRAVLTNTATKMLIKQDTAILDEIVKQFNLNDAEKRFMKISTAGRALLIAETARIPIYIQASPEEHRIITTRPDEMLNIVNADIKKPAGKDTYREFNINLPLHRKIDLTDDQLKQLEVREFMELRIKTLSGESDLFLFKNDSEDTAEHFVLQHLILEEIRKYTNKGLIHHTRLPDVTFEAPNGKMIAIEVETDVGLKRSLENMEQKLNVMKKYDDYFFVVENSSIVQDYKEKFGTMIGRTDVPAKIASYFT
ncbi:MAG: ATP-binding protein [Candidatus Altiarchaeota archaeon]|nr:ATP-binding protein [Candidatus Altiarchaeota archaeon]